MIRTLFSIVLAVTSHIAFAAPFLELPQPIALDNKTLDILALDAPAKKTGDNSASILFFGYTKCTDVCPMSIHHTHMVIDVLEEEGIDLAGIFVTIDTERDTLEAIADYFAIYENRFHTIRPSENQLKYLQDTFGYEAVDYNRFDGNNNYVIDHSATSFIIDGDNNVISMLDLSEHHVDPGEVADKVVALLNKRSQS